MYTLYIRRVVLDYLGLFSTAERSCFNIYRCFLPSRPGLSVAADFLI